MSKWVDVIVCLLRPLWGPFACLYFFLLKPMWCYVIKPFYKYNPVWHYVIKPVLTYGLNPVYYILFHLLLALWCTKALGIYGIDVYTDIGTSYHHFMNGDIFWCIQTLVYALLPVILIGIVSTFGIVQQNGDSMLRKCFLVIQGTALAPFLPLLHLMKDAATSLGDSSDRIRYDKNLQFMNNLLKLISHILRFLKVSLTAVCEVSFIYGMMIGFTTIVGHSPEEAELSAGLVKLLEVMLESLPQGTLQIYIIAQTWNGWAHVETWQWATITISLLALAHGISTNVYVFGHGNTASRIIVFFFGLINVASKIIVCCLFSMIHRYLVCLPICLALLITILIWLDKNLPEWSGFDIWGMVVMVLTWLLTTSFDCFSMAGRPATAVNMMFSTACLFLPMPVPQSAAIAAATLSVLSFACNVVLTEVALFQRHFGDKWMNRNTIKLCPEEVLAKKIVVTYSTIADRYTRSFSSSDDQGVTGWRAGLDSLNGRVDRYQSESQAYLRLGSDTTTTLRWRVSWPGSADLIPNTITVHMTHARLGRGNVSWHIVLGGKIFPPTAPPAIFEGHTWRDSWGSVGDNFVRTKDRRQFVNMTGGYDNFVRTRDRLHLSAADLAYLSQVRHMEVAVTMTGDYYFDALLFWQDKGDYNDHPFYIIMNFR